MKLIKSTSISTEDIEVALSIHESITISIQRWMMNHPGYKSDIFITVSENTSIVEVRVYADKKD